MTTLNIELPDRLGRFLKKKAAKEGFANSAEYVKGLILRERGKKSDAREGLEALLLAGLDSGPRIRVDAEYWKRKKALLMRRHKAGKA